MSQRLTITCDRCGKQTITEVSDDPFILLEIKKTNTYMSGLGYTFNFPKTVDICRDCYIDFNDWLKEKK